MKKPLSILVALALLGSSILVSPSASAWTPGANIAVSVFKGNARASEARWMALDSSGNILTAGYFEGTVDFDPGDGVANLTSAGSNDIFVSKLDSSGNYLWAKRIGGSGYDHAAAVAVDKYGSVITTGGFAGTVDFDPGAGVANLTSVGRDVDIFVSKLDSSGNYLWAKRMGGVGFDHGIIPATDSDGNIAVTGFFTGTADFDPGEGVINLTSAGNIDIFISKFDPAGNFIWAKGIGSTEADGGGGIAFDGSGNIYTSGGFSGTVDFDSGNGVFNLTSAGKLDIFISKHDSAGNFVWAKNVGGTGDDGSAPHVLDSRGNIYLTGIFPNTADFDPGIGVANLTSAGSLDGFVLKLDSSGNYIWAKSYGSTGSDEAYSISVDGNGGVITSGTFSGTVDFDPGAGIANLISAGGSDVFISKLDSSGNYLWGKRIGGTGSDRGYANVVDQLGMVYTSGVFRETADFDPGSGTANFRSNGGADVFISKLDSLGNAPLVASVSAGVVANSKIAYIPSGGTEAAISATRELPAIKLNFGGGVPTAVTVVPIAVNPAPASATPFVISPSTKIVDIQLSGSFSGSATVCLEGAETDGLYHFTNGGWSELGSRSYVNGQVCGITTSFSPFTAAPRILIPASISSLDFIDDGSGTGGKVAWAGKNIDAVLYTGPASSYPGPFNFGAFSTSWNGSIRNLTPETDYTISIYAISVDGIGESKSLTFKTGAKTEVVKNLNYWNTWLTANTFVPGEAASIGNLLSKFNLLETSPHRSYIKVPTSRVSKVEVTSLTPASCSVVSAMAKVDAGLVKALTTDKCTISYTVSGPSKAPATLVKDFVFKKVS